MEREIGLFDRYPDFSNGWQYDSAFTGFDRQPDREPLLDMARQDNRYTIVISKNMEGKIRYLCQRYPNREWSGTMFYDIEGSMADGSLKVTCKDLVLMDIGCATYTEYEIGQEVASYMARHIDLFSMYMGTIHSHNNMAAFFSGTDTATLREQGSKWETFVSLVVNNAGKYAAAITTQVEYDVETTKHGKMKSFGCDENSGIIKEKSKEKKILCNDFKEIQVIGSDAISDDVSERADFLEKEAKKAKKEREKAVKKAMKETTGYSNIFDGKHYVYPLRKTGRIGKVNNNVSDVTYVSNVMHVIMSMLFFGSMFRRNGNKAVMTSDILRTVRLMEDNVYDMAGNIIDTVFENVVPTLIPKGLDNVKEVKMLLTKTRRRLIDITRKKNYGVLAKDYEVMRCDDLVSEYIRNINVFMFNMFDEDFDDKEELDRKEVSDEYKS